MTKENQKGLVYIVQNPAFSHLFKIGHTGKPTVEDRGLNASNVPEDFDILFVYECNNPEKVEEHLFDTFKQYRHYSITGRKTEFLYVGCLLQAKKTLELLKGVKEVEVSDDIVDVLEKDDKTEYDETRNIEEIARQKPFNFNIVNIKPGTILVFTENPKEECIVEGKRKVLYKNEKYSLSNLTKKLMEKLGQANDSGSYRGPDFFKVKGENETLTEKRGRMEGNKR